MHNWTGWSSVPLSVFCRPPLCPREMPMRQRSRACVPGLRVWRAAAEGLALPAGPGAAARGSGTPTLNRADKAWWTLALGRPGEPAILERLRRCCKNLARVIQLQRIGASPFSEAWWRFNRVGGWCPDYGWIDFKNILGANLRETCWRVALRMVRKGASDVFMGNGLFPLCEKHSWSMFLLHVIHGFVCRASGVAWDLAAWDLACSEES